MARSAIFFTCATLWLTACDRQQKGTIGTPITPIQLADRIREGSAPLVLDVRTPQEYAQGHIPGAVNIPHDELPTRLDELPISEPDEVVVHCRSGRRARLAEDVLRERGYSNIRDLTGHWEAWQKGELPTE